MRRWGISFTSGGSACPIAVSVVVVWPSGASQSRKSIWVKRPRTSTVPRSSSVVNSVTM